ncbi:MAG TPA: hypothetical protein VJR58_18310 [Vineibacter sp.]|nr:hypothetical protein [Vineibacter sp.]
MRKVAVSCLGVLSGLCALAAGASAQQYTYLGGLYESASVSLRIIVLDSETGDVAWESSVRRPGGPGCGGGAAGLGKIVAGKLELRPYKREPEAGACVITATLGPKGPANDPGPRSLALDEKDCLYYHGASCGWEGVVNRKPEDR